MALTRDLVWKVSKPGDLGLSCDCENSFYIESVPILGQA